MAASAGCSSGETDGQSRRGSNIRKDRRHLSDTGVELLLESLANGGISDLEVSDDDPDDPLWEEDVATQFRQESDSDNDTDDAPEASNQETEEFISESTQQKCSRKSKQTKRTRKNGNKTNATKTKIDRFGWKNIEFTTPDTTWRGKLKESEYDELPTPFALFTKYYGNYFFQNVADKTNSYSLRSSGKSVNTNMDEIRQLFGMNILMGCLRFPQLRMYWASYTRIPRMAETMSRARFSSLRNNLHVVDEEAQSHTNRIWKVQPFIDQFQNRCLQFQLEQDLSIDEEIIPFKGKLNIKQYVKGKPIPWGIKVFLLCGKSGLVYNCIIYQGSTTPISAEDMKEFGLGPSVIKTLSERIPRQENYKLYFDNYFSSVKIFQYLLGEGILAAGTIRKDRAGALGISEKNKKVIEITENVIEENDLTLGAGTSSKIGKRNTGTKVSAKKKRGESTQFVNREKDVDLTEWFDNKEVTLASNFTGIGEQDQAQRWDKVAKTYVSVTRPEIVRKYNESMGGVDTMDMLIALYRISLRTRKWPLRVMFHFVDLAICNSWIEYRETARHLKVKEKNILKLLPFRIEIAESLLKAGIVPQEKKRGRPSADAITPPKKRKTPATNIPNVDVRFDNIGHMPIIVSEKSQRCRLEVCSFKTRYQCEKCQVFLCLVRERNCFKKFHTR